jgi:hypothetical protein
VEGKDGGRWRLGLGVASYCVLLGKVTIESAEEYSLAQDVVRNIFRTGLTHASCCPTGGGLMLMPFYVCFLYQGSDLEKCNVYTSEDVPKLVARNIGVGPVVSGCR